MAQRGAELQPWIPAPLRTGDLVEGSAHQLVGPGSDEPEREPVQQPDDQRLVARRGHVREGLDLHVRETAVQLVLETRGREHADDVIAQQRDAGYEARVVR